MFAAAATAAAAVSAAVATWFVRRRRPAHAAAAATATATTTTTATTTNATADGKKEFLGVPDIMFLTFDSAGSMPLYHMNMRLITSSEKAVFAQILQHYDQIQYILQQPSHEKAAARQDVLNAYNHSLKISRLVRELGESIVATDGGGRVRCAEVLENGSHLADSINADLAAVRAHTEQLTRIY